MAGKLLNIITYLVFLQLASSCGLKASLDSLTSKSDESRSPSPTPQPQNDKVMGDIIWSKSFGGTGNDSVNAVAFSGDDIIFCGTTRNSYSVDLVNVVANTTNDEFATGKCTKDDCTVQWIKTAGKTESNSFCAGIDSDSSGNIYSGGTFYGNINFGLGMLGNNGDRDMTLVKYSSSGVLDWGISFGGTAGEELNGLIITPNDNIITSGFFRNTVNFGSGNITSAGDADAFISTYNTSGVNQISNKYGLANKDYFWDVATDSSSNIYATGEMIGNINLGGGALTQIGGRDIFLAKYSNSASHLWSIVFGGTGEEYTRDLATNSTGEVVVAGTSNGAFNVAGIGHVNQGGSDIILVKVSNDSTILWAKAFGTSANEGASDVEFDQDGNIILIANFSGTINMGGDNLVSNGNQDFLIAKYDPQGNHLFSKSYGGTGTDSANSIKIDSENNIIIGGSFQGSINFESETLISNGNSDHLIFKIKNK